MVASVRDRALVLCEAALDATSSPDARATIEATRDRLVEPLRVAVAGRIKAGKSTLVNALLRQRVAPVGVAETTKVVTWFRFGSQERITVVPRSGASPWTVAFTEDGRIPDALGADPTDIERIDVWLSNDALRSLTIIDTPGLNSLDVESSQRTRDVLALDPDSRAAVAQADALVYLLPHLGSDEIEALSAFRALFTGTAFSAVSVVGVVSKIDQLDGADSDLGATADRVSSDYERRLRGTVSRVVPVVGLLGETTDADAFTETDAHALRVVAGQPDDLVGEALLSPDLFVGAPLPIDVGRRERLVELLDLTGIRLGIDAVRSGATTTSAIAAVLRSASGLGALRALLVHQFGDRADALKVHAALSDLDRVTYLTDYGTDDGAASIRNDVETLRTDPELHQLAELEALRAWAAGGIMFPADLDRDLSALASSSSLTARLGLPAEATESECAEAAMQRAVAWRTCANNPLLDGAATKIAATMLESFTILWEQTARGTANLSSTGTDLAP